MRLRRPTRTCLTARRSGVWQSWPVTARRNPWRPRRRRMNSRPSTVLTAPSSCGSLLYRTIRRRAWGRAGAPAAVRCASAAGPSRAAVTGGRRCLDPQRTSIPSSARPRPLMSGQDQKHSSIRREPSPRTLCAGSRVSVRWRRRPLAAERPADPRRKRERAPRRRLRVPGRGSVGKGRRSGGLLEDQSLGDQPIQRLSCRLRTDSEDLRQFRYGRGLSLVLMQIEKPAQAARR